MKVKIGDICTLKSGTSLKEDILNENNGIPYIKVSDMNLVGNEKYIVRANSYADESISEKMLFPEGTVLFPKRGGAIGTNKKRIASKKVCADLNTMGVIPSDKIRPLYLYYYFQNIDFSTLYNGSSVPQINNTDIAPMEINLISLEEQDGIVTLLEKTDDIVRKRKEELSALDDLIKARFVEMFGDPLINSFGIKTKPMTEVCEIIDGDRGKNYPTVDEFTDEGYCLFLNAKNVSASGFNFDTCMFVSKEKDEVLRKGKLSRGDVVLTTRGTLGNLAFYTDDIPFEHVRINSGMVILRMKQELVNEVYFIEQFKMQLADIKEKIASGSAQPQLPISTMNKIQILIPDIEIQKQFADFVHQVDKSKVVGTTATSKM